MANKNRKETLSWREKEKLILEKEKLIKILSWAALFYLAVILLLMLLDWAAVYNTDIADNEVRVSGFNCVAAGLSGNFTSANRGSFGDMAVPFNYYAASYVHPLAYLSVAVLFVLIAHIVLSLFTAIVKKKKPLLMLCMAFSVAETVLFILCFAKGLSMQDSQILPIYCSGNPACSIHSQAILPAILSFFYLAFPVFALVKGRKEKMPAPLQKGGQEKGRQSKEEGKNAHPRATAFKGSRYTKR